MDAEHPESAEALAAETRERIETRQQALARVGRILRELANPEARYWHDHLRFLDRRALTKQQELVEKVLERHGDAFIEPEEDPFAVTTQRTAPALLEVTSAAWDSNS